MTGWPTARRGGVVLTGVEVGVATDGASLRVPVTIAGLTPGMSVQLDATGSYQLSWTCWRPDPSSDIGVAPADGGSGQGTATATVTVRVDGSGIGMGTVVLPGPSRAESCPSGYPDSSVSMGRWDGVRITDAARGLVLAPDEYRWAVTV